MPSTPVIACSSGEATVSPITSGLAPGKVARTTTVGGTTSGYSLIGNWNSDMAPLIRINSDSTAAKIGRWIKNCEKFIVFYLLATWRSAGGAVFCSDPAAVLAFDGLALFSQQRLGLFIGHGHALRINRGAGERALQTVNHDLLALGQTATHDAQAFELWPQLDGAVLHGVVLIEHQYELLAQVRADRLILDQRSGVLTAAD